MIRDPAPMIRVWWCPVALGLVLSVALACGDDAPPEPYEEPPEPWIGSDREHLRDDAGRAVVLRGVNARVEGLFDVTFDDGRTALEPIPAFGRTDARRMRELGLNVLRLPVNWSGMEPEEGAYDEAYLDRLEAVVELCAEERVHVLIDFHQDAYSKHIGEDGAPLWAIHPPPDMLLEGPLEDLEERRLSGQVQRAFEGFFVDDDEDTTDRRLQAAFFAMAQHVAERFVDEPWVVGYDLYNEPVIGDEYLWRFHDALAAALREVDGRHLLFFEPNAVRNLIETAPTPREPFVDPGGVYAPHLYTLAFGDPSGELESISRSRLAPNVMAAMRESRSWEVPIFVGEWGIDPNGTNGLVYIELMQDLFDEHHASSAFWVWKERSQGRWGVHDHDDASGEWSEREALVEVLSRPYAERIAGDPVTMRWDDEAGLFELVYQGRRDDAPSRIYVPERFASGYEVRCDGAAVDPQPERAPTTGMVEVVCAGAGERTVEVALR